MIRSFLKYVAGFGLALVCLQALAVIETYEFDNESERERYEHLIDVLRCPKCQNQNLAGSNSPVAEDLRRELARQIRAGRQDGEIVDYLVARYGDFIRYDPKFQKNTVALWLGPGLLLALGLGWAIVVVRRQQRSRASQASGAGEPFAPETTQTPKQDAPASSVHRRLAWPVLAVACVAVAGGTLALYLRLGAFEQLQIAQAIDRFYSEVQQAGRSQRAPDLAPGRDLVALLLPYVQRHPEDVNLAYVLGSTYVQLSQFEAAVPWYKQYLMAIPDDERVLTEYVQLLYLVAQQELTERVRFVADRALMLNPHNPEVLALLAMHYQRHGQFAEALPYWDRLLESLPPDSGLREAVQKARDEAQAQAALPQTPSAKP